MPTQGGYADTVPAEQEQGFRQSLFGFAKEDVLAYMNSRAEESRRQSEAYQEEIQRLQAEIDKLRGEQTAARACVEKLQKDLSDAQERAEDEKQVRAQAQKEAQSQTLRLRGVQEELNRSQLHCRDLEKEILKLHEDAQQQEALRKEAQPTDHDAEKMLAGARQEARKILADARLYAQSAEEQLQKEENEKRQRMAEHAADLSTGISILRGRLARVDEKLGAACLDLENATAAIYEALDQADRECRDLGTRMRDFPDGHSDPEKGVDRTQQTNSAAPRYRAAVQPVLTKRQRPSRRFGRLRRTVSDELLNAMDHFEEGEKPF